MQGDLDAWHWQVANALHGIRPKGVGALFCSLRLHASQLGHLVYSDRTCMACPNGFGSKFPYPLYKTRFLPCLLHHSKHLDNFTRLSLKILKSLEFFFRTQALDHWDLAGWFGSITWRINYPKLSDPFLLNRISSYFTKLWKPLSRVKSFRFDPGRVSLDYTRARILDYLSQHSAVVHKGLDSSLETWSMSSTFAFNLEGFIDGFEARVT